MVVFYAELRAAQRFEVTELHASTGADGTRHANAPGRAPRSAKTLVLVASLEDQAGSSGSCTRNSRGRGVSVYSAMPAQYAWVGRLKLGRVSWSRVQRSRGP